MAELEAHDRGFTVVDDGGPYMKLTLRAGDVSITAELTYERLAHLREVNDAYGARLTRLLSHARPSRRERRAARRA